MPLPVPPSRSRARLLGRLGAVVLSGVALGALVTVCPAPVVPSPTASANAASRGAETSSGEALTAADVDAWLDGFLPAALEREGIAGAVVSVVSSGAVVTERGFGVADTGAGRGRPVPVDADRTLFRIGSVSKLVTATAVMQLVESGDLDLDAPVTNYLDMNLNTRFPEPVTVRHLLTHTAGFEDKLHGVITTPDAGATSLRDAVVDDPPEQIFPPGTVPAYSNYSDGLAAAVVQQVTGKAFADVIEERIFAAAGMDTATLEQPLPHRLRQAMSKGYDHVGSDEVPFEVVSPAPAGAISATASDMSAFMLAQLDPGGPLLDADTLREMQGPGLGANDLGGLANGPRMTLGFFEENRNGHRVIGHGGDLTAFHAQLDLWPDDGAGIFVSLNSTGIRGDGTTAIRQALVDGFADRYFPGPKPDLTPAATAATHADAVAGTYQVSRRSESTFLRMYAALSTVEITRGPADTISISALTDTSGTPVRLVEIAPWVWQELDGDRRVAVDQRDGKVRAVGLNPAFTLQPLPPVAAALPGVLVVSLLTLALTTLASIVSVIARIFASRRAGVQSSSRAPHPQRSHADRWLTIFLGTATVALLGAGVLWSIAASALLSDGSPSALLLRSAQALTLIAVLGFVPAAGRTALMIRSARNTTTGYRLRPNRTRVAVIVRGATALAFVGLTFAAIAGGFLAPSITY